MRFMTNSVGANFGMAKRSLVLLIKVEFPSYKTILCINSIKGSKGQKFIIR